MTTVRRLKFNTHSKHAPRLAANLPLIARGCSVNSSGRRGESLLPGVQLNPPRRRRRHQRRPDNRNGLLPLLPPSPCRHHGPWADGPGSRHPPRRLLHLCCQCPCWGALRSVPLHQHRQAPARLGVAGGGSRGGLRSGWHARWGRGQVAVASRPHASWQVKGFRCQHDQMTWVDHCPPPPTIHVCALCRLTV